MAASFHTALLRTALHLDHQLMDELVNCLTYLDSPVKFAAHALAAFHMHRSTHGSH
jgi:hypothetical protein